MQVGEPVFSLKWLSRKSLLLFGSGKGLGVLRKSGRQDLLHYIAWDCMYAGEYKHVCTASGGVSHILRAFSFSFCGK